MAQIFGANLVKTGPVKVKCPKILACAWNRTESSKYERGWENSEINQWERVHYLRYFINMNKFTCELRFGRNLNFDRHVVTATSISHLKASLLSNTGGVSCRLTSCFVCIWFCFRLLSSSDNFLPFKRCSSALFNNTSFSLEFLSFSASYSWKSKLHHNHDNPNNKMCRSWAESRSI